jgi:uncharacterized protein YegL
MMSSTSRNRADIEALLQGALAEGDLSPETFAALTISGDFTNQLKAGLGVLPDDVPASEVVLVTLLVDDSGSISSINAQQAIIAGHNMVLDALKQSKVREGVLVHTRYLNGQVLSPYVPLEQAVSMTKRNYQANGGTPLYDQTAVILGTVLTKTREFAEAGVPVRSITVILTDGEDAHSLQHSAHTVSKIVADMRRAESHIIAALGVGDSALFHRVFTAMGIDSNWILTSNSSTQEIRAAFRVVSQSVAQFTQGGLGAGFAN